MEHEKPTLWATEQNDAGDRIEGDEVNEVTKGGTTADQWDMRRMGKLQELRRDFKPISIFGFAMILMASWETALGVLALGLINGGTAGFIYTYIGVWVAFIAIYTAMAEMGSMAPTSGGQYHWVSEFAPREYQRGLSYLVGWLCVLGWQCAVAGTCFLSGTYIQGLLVLNYDWYVYERWHGTLFVIGVALFCLLFNTFLARNLAMVEGIILVLHIFGFFGIVVPLWVLSPRASSWSVWTSFIDSGWGNNGLSCLVGTLASILPLLGADSAAHMSEELQDASYNLPWTMLRTTVLNGAMGLIMIITVSYCIGDIDTVLDSETGFPFMQVFYNSTKSLAATNAMIAVVMILSTFCSITMMATASRQLFAFARDKGVPFSDLLAHVRPGWDIPLNAVIFSFVFTSLLSLINIGSYVAFDNISSLSTAALLLSYIVSTACLLWRKVCKKPLLPSRFELGSLGIAINVFAILSLATMFLFTFFPTSPKPDAASMNYDILMFGAVVLWSTGYYYAYGRHQYVGPVEYVRKLE